MNISNSKSPFLLLISTIIFIVKGEKSIQFAKTVHIVDQDTLPQQQLARLDFYFDDNVSGPNASAVPVTKPPNPPSSFEVITIMDDPLTKGRDPKSKLVGRAQGMHASAAQEEIGLLQVMNLYFSVRKYNGSVLTVSRTQCGYAVCKRDVGDWREWDVQVCRGFALARTHWLDLKTKDAIVEYNVIFMYPSLVLAFLEFGDMCINLLANT